MRSKQLPTQPSPTKFLVGLDICAVAPWLPSEWLHYSVSFDYLSVNLLTFYNLEN